MLAAVDFPSFTSSLDLLSLAIWCPRLLEHKQSNSFFFPLFYHSFFVLTNFFVESTTASGGDVSYYEHIGRQFKLHTGFLIAAAMYGRLLELLSVIRFDGRRHIMKYRFSVSPNTFVSSRHFPSAESRKFLKFPNRRRADGDSGVPAYVTERWLAGKCDVTHGRRFTSGTSACTSLFSLVQPRRSGQLTVHMQSRRCQNSIEMRPESSSSSGWNQAPSRGKSKGLANGMSKSVNYDPKPVELLHTVYVKLIITLKYKKSFTKKLENSN